MQRSFKIANYPMTGPNTALVDEERDVSCLIFNNPNEMEVHDLEVEEFNE